MTTAFPLVQHKIKLTTGSVTGSIVHCELDGSIDITFTDGGVVSGYAMLAGEDRSLGGDVKHITITGGTFSVA